MIPSPRLCYELMDIYGMWAHIRAHSIMVAKVAALMARSLRASGEEHLSLPKTVAGALLHDIGKTPSLKTGGDHAEIGREICLTHQLDEIADIVGEHVRLKERNGLPRFSEKHIVYYADKRVNHDRVVSLDDRLAYILDRYGHLHPLAHPLIRANFAYCRGLEQHLFARLAFEPSEVAPMTATVDLDAEAD